MLIKIIRSSLVVLYVSSVYSANYATVSSYLGYDRATILSNAQQCYKEGLCDISFDLCQAYIVGEKWLNVPMDIPSVKARILLGLNLLKKQTGIDVDHFNRAEDALLEICCEPEKTKFIDINSLVSEQDHAWRVLANLYIAQKAYQKGAICLYNSLAVQYNAYNERHPHVFPKHASNQLRYIVQMMRHSKEYKSDILSLTAGIAEDQSWFIDTLLKRAWCLDDSLDALWLLAQHKRICENPRTKFEKVLYPFQLYQQLAKMIKMEQHLDLNELSVELLKDHSELVNSYSFLCCRADKVKHYSVYKEIKKDCFKYVTDRNTADKDKTIFLAFLRGVVIGKGILRKLPLRHSDFDGHRELPESVPNIALRLFVDEAFKGKRVDAKLAETILLYAQENLQAENVRVSSNNTSYVGEFNIAMFLRKLQVIKNSSRIT